MEGREGLTAINAPNSAALLVTVFAPLLGSAVGAGLVVELVVFVRAVVVVGDCAAARERMVRRRRKVRRRVVEARDIAIVWGGGCSEGGGGLRDGRRGR